VDRRALLGWMVATGGLSALNRLSAADLLAMGRDAHALPAAPRDDVPALDARTAAIVTAAAERIIPATDTPGATQANVTEFIETMLSGWYAPAERDRFVSGVHELDGRATAQYACAFAACKPSEQDALLEGYDRVVNDLRAAHDPSVNAHWFATLKYLTVWGFCTSEVGMRDVLHSWPQPMRYDGNAAVGT
jgi:gluconate 2-dehydrogenase gamma chain